MDHDWAICVLGWQDAPDILYEPNQSFQVLWHSVVWPTFEMEMSHTPPFPSTCIFQPEIGDQWRFKTHNGPNYFYDTDLIVDVTESMPISCLINVTSIFS